MCRKDYPDVLAEAVSEPFTDLLDAGCGTGALLAGAHSFGNGFWFAVALL